MKMKNTANRDTAWYGARTASLAEFMTPERNEVLRRTVAMRTRYMTVLAENMFHGQNAAALIRHCEAFGIQEMHTVETLCRFDPIPISPAAPTNGSTCGAIATTAGRSPHCAGTGTASWRRHPTARM